MATSDIKFETPITSGFPELNRFRLTVHDVVMEPGDYPEHTHEGPGLRIVRDGAIEITQQGKMNRYQKGDYFFEGGTSLIRSRCRVRRHFVRSMWRFCRRSEGSLLMRV